MKSFLKLIVSVIVILVIGFTVYFLIQGMSNYNASNASGDVIDNQLSGDIDNKNLEENIENNYIEDSQTNNNSKNQGEVNVFEVSGEKIDVNGLGDIKEASGELLESENIVQAINEAKMIENQNKNEIVINTVEDNIGLEIIGTEYKELLNMLETNTLSVNVQTAGTMVYILPVSDFVNNQQYHYDENGNLVLYISELMGIGGEIRYYFYNNQLIKTEDTVEEELFINYENSNEIIQRAKVVYDKYFKQ